MCLCMHRDRYCTIHPALCKVKLLEWEAIYKSWFKFQTT